MRLGVIVELVGVGKGDKQNPNQSERSLHINECTRGDGDTRSDTLKAVLSSPVERQVAGAACAMLGTICAAFGAHALEAAYPLLAVGVRGAGYGTLLLGAHLYTTGAAPSETKSFAAMSVICQAALYALAVLGAVAKSPDNLPPSLTALAYILPILMIPLSYRTFLHRQKPSGWGITCIEVGGIIFAASLLAITYTDKRVFGAITPIGGALMILGWGGLARAAYLRTAEEFAHPDS